MTEKEVYAAIAAENEIKEDTVRKIIGDLCKLIETEEKVTFGKIGAFVQKSVKAVPARTGVKNPLTGGTYDTAAKPARTKIGFTLSKHGKTLGL